MFHTDDVVNFAPEKCVVFVDQAIFTKILSTSSNKMHELLADVTTYL